MRAQVTVTSRHVQGSEGGKEAVYLTICSPDSEINLPRKIIILSLGPVSHCYTEEMKFIVSFYGDKPHPTIAIVLT